MALATNALVTFYDSYTDLSSTPAAVNDGALSVAGDLNTWTNDDNTERATVTLKGQYPSGTLVTDARIDVIAQLIDVIGTDDTPAPTTAYEQIFCGSFRVKAAQAVSTDAFYQADIRIPGGKSGQVIQFYLSNKTGVQMSASWTFQIADKSIGPKA